MTHPDDERTDLTPADEAFVRRVAEAYTVPRLPAARAAAFGANLQNRLQRRRRLGRAPLFLGAAAAAALFLLVIGNLAPNPSTVTEAPVVTMIADDVDADTPATPESTLLALVTDPFAESEAALPDDYRAIETLFLGE